MDGEAYEEIIHYHERTKHHLHRFARSPGHMDWANQPDPFRTYRGGKAIRLPLQADDPAGGHLDLYKRGNIAPRAFTTETIAGFLELSMGLSAWKGAGTSRWALRMNPSSGNLHPTEAYLVLPAMEGIGAGVYHYHPFAHELEPRAELPDTLWPKICRHFGTDGFFLGLSSIFWREPWKYGERAFRYCHLDAGHALAGLSFSAALYGWKVTYLNALSDRQVETVLGFDRTDWYPQEQEHPDLLCFVHGHTRSDVPGNLPGEVVADFEDLSFNGTPNPLSRKRINWKIIYRTAALVRKPETAEQRYQPGETDLLPGPGTPLTAPQIIRNRRSGSDYDRNGSISRTQFLAILDKTLPRKGGPPFDVGLDDPRVHLLLFVHHVAGIPPGLYFFFRNDRDMAEIRHLTRSEFSWEPVTDQLPLFCLSKGDFRFKAMEVSCNQQIAGFSAFSLGMIANFRKTLKKEPFRYRHLHWECGMIGQVLYLEAEAQGMRGTGIGCFFDDPVHDMIGLPDNTYQSLYHFTVGVPVEDPGLATYPPYFHLNRKER